MLKYITILHWINFSKRENGFRNPKLEESFKEFTGSR
jgi:hypothetical protein